MEVVCKYKSNSSNKAFEYLEKVNIIIIKK